MLEDSNKACRICGENIPAEAIKCRHCGSFQNWRRFLDVGQGTIALLIALISVVTLAVESGTRAFDNFFANPLAPSISGKILQLSIDEAELLFSNNGSSRGYLDEGALCRVPLVREGVDLVLNTGELIRYPRRDEVVGIYAVSYLTGQNARFLEADSGTQFKVQRSGIFKEEGLPIRDGATEVKGYCFVRWIGQDAGEDGAFLPISALDSYTISRGLADLPYGETTDAKAEGREADTTPLRLLNADNKN